MSLIQISKKAMFCATQDTSFTLVRILLGNYDHYPLQMLSFLDRSILKYQAPARQVNF